MSRVAGRRRGPLLRHVANDEVEDLAAERIERAARFTAMRSSRRNSIAAGRSLLRPGMSMSNDAAIISTCTPRRWRSRWARKPIKSVSPRPGADLLIGASIAACSGVADAGQRGDRIAHLARRRGDANIGSSTGSYGESRRLSSPLQPARPAIQPLGRGGRQQLAQGRRRGARPPRGAPRDTADIKACARSTLIGLRADQRPGGSPLRGRSRQPAHSSASQPLPASPARRSGWSACRARASRSSSAP